MALLTRAEFNKLVAAAIDEAAERDENRLGRRHLYVDRATVAEFLWARLSGQLR